MKLAKVPLINPVQDPSIIVKCRVFDVIGMRKFVEIFPNNSALIERAHLLVAEKIREAIASRDLCTIALAGGSTPKPLYEAVAQDSLPWPKIHFFWGDERYVPSEHPDSNQKMARQAWLDRVELPECNIHPMPTDAQNPEIDAEKYQQELSQFFGSDSGEFPRFELILLGMGDDGHTASLFPYTTALTVGDRLVTAGNKDGQPRLTFTVPLINAARCVIFLVAGSNKQDALEQIFALSGDKMTYPAGLIQPQGELWWLLDESAAEKIKSLV